ncbi:MAG: hypothetical protein CO119_05875 [Flavobacteriales bacterium CG_4_9_14_3_um_filter_40_17]|nr:MAG: hypothetical protein CO119_05875 [Flavobacteriales bacterium CG_4_9_14_3_um_filter_40_17]
MQTDVPKQLLATEKILLKTNLPKSKALQIDKILLTFIFNYYNLDPLWHSEEADNRILLIEPCLFADYPASEKCIDFMLALGKNIPNLQLYVGTFQSLYQLD